MIARKPLILFTPKSILRHPKAVSTFDEVSNGQFREVIGDSSDPKGVTRIVFSAGKIYYDLLAERDKQNASHVALIRLEQIYPFSESQVTDILARYSPSAEVAWVQEEPRNMGAWRFVAEQFEAIRKIRYIGRPENPSPATGSKKRHDQEQADIVKVALS